jgi:UDP-N-acetylmuramoylalanine-D-glutamate ligase
MDEGWNPAGHIAEMVRDMDLQKRYDFLVTAISVVNTLNVQTLGDVHDVETSVNEAIEELKSGNVEVTENVCDQLQDTLSEMLETSPLMLANSDQVREMMDAASMGTVNAVDFTSVHYDDFRHKNMMALATWIEYKNGNLPSLPDNMLPEIMGVSIAAGVEGIKKDTIRKAFSDFSGVEHRLEPVAKVRSVLFINDSKATNVNSCWYALQCMQTPVVLILGGKDKGNDYTEIEDLVKEKVKAIVCLGVDNTKLHQFFDGKVENIADASSMEEAVNKCFAFADKGDTVLLSPCCASFDLFKSYEDRGQQFKECVKRL